MRIVFRTQRRGGAEKRVAGGLKVHHRGAEGTESFWTLRRRGAEKSEAIGLKVHHRGAEGTEVFGR